MENYTACTGKYLLICVHTRIRPVLENVRMGEWENVGMGDVGI